MSRGGPRRRVGVTGFAHEVNVLADAVGLGEGIDAARSAGGLAESWEAGALVRRLRDGASVEVVELPTWEFGASGPLRHDDFLIVLDQVDAALRSAGRLDAIVVLGHGAGRTTIDLDPDATFLGLVRHAVGPSVPVVTVLDFHANLSSSMVEMSDVVVAYRTNPHVDIRDRLVEAADHVIRLLDVPGTTRVHCRLPMVLPQLAQNTTPGEPLGEVVARGVELASPPVRNVSVTGGFSLSDVPDCGVSVCVTADDSPQGAARAREVCAELADMAWSLRPRYRVSATALDEAVSVARRAAAGEIPPVLLADVADNPGGGAPGNATFVLRALMEARVDGVVMGLHCDPDVVEAAWRAGEGGSLRARFNAAGSSPLAPPLDADAIVLRLVDGPLVPTRGVYAGAERHPGRSCALDLGGIRLGVSTRKVQCADADTLAHVGLDPSGAKVVVVKSRGHFRAGFDHLFPDAAIVEVSAPGVATIDLAATEWRHLPRPVFPLDEVEDWSPRVDLYGPAR